MHLQNRWLLLGAAAWLLSGCGYSSSGTGPDPAVTGASTSGGTTTPPAQGSSKPIGPATIAGAHDTVVATPSVAGTVTVVAGATQTISLTFTSSDGNAITAFAISGTTLPSDWSGPTGFSCALVSSGGNCVLNLSYSPTAVEAGTLSINYIFIDNANQAMTKGSIDIPYAATAYDNVDAVAAPSGQINVVLGSGAQPVTVNFTTDDGFAATDLTLTSSLSDLPAGWTSTASSFTCAIVSTGNGCQLALSYAPSAAASGTLTLNYGYTDDFGEAKTGQLNIPYATASPDNVIAVAAPGGQVNAAINGGSRDVAVTFTTDDGGTATKLYVQTDLSTLPAGWTSSSKAFDCAGVSTGNGCQLHVKYAPTKLAAGTLAVAYGYTDSAANAKIGVLNIAYAATTNDNVLGTASPSGQINAVVGMGTQSVTVSFTTDDARLATNLQLTGSLAALPAGWSAGVPVFACSEVLSGSGCQLTLSYNPTEAGNGSLTLPYSYVNNAGEAKTGTVNIPYRATTNDNVVATPSQAVLSVQTGTTTPVTVAFTTDDGNLATHLAVTAGLSTLPAGWTSSSPSFVCANVSVGAACTLALSYAPAAADSGALTLGYSYLNDAGFAKTGTATINYSAVTPPPPPPPGP